MVLKPYGGLLAAILASFPSTAMFWCFYEWLKIALAEIYWISNHTRLIHILAACVGSVADSLTRNPFEVVK